MGIFIRDGRLRSGWRVTLYLLAYLLALQVAVYIAAPFFTTYMLWPLRLSYP